MPLFWNPDNDIIPIQFRGSVRFVADALKEGCVRESFDPPGDGVIGVAKVTKGFRHMHFDFTGTIANKRRHLAGLSPASTHELANMLERVLKDNIKEVVDRAAYLLIEDKLSHSDKHKS